MFDKFNSVQQVTGLGPHCPAMLNLLTGDLMLNMDVWPFLTTAQRRDVVSHEEGHWVLQTRDENRADEYSLLKQAAGGHSLKQAVAAMTEILDPNNPDHVNRAWMRLQMAQRLDAQTRTGKEPTAAYNGNGGCGCSDCLESGNHFVGYGILGICLSKKCKKAKAEKQAVKLELKVERQEANNTAKVLLAEQGIKGGIGGVFEGLGNAVANIVPAVTGIATGGIGALAGNAVTQALTGQTQPAVADMLNPGLTAGGGDAAAMYQMLALQAQQEAEAKKKKQTTWIIVAVVAVVLIGTAIFFLTKKPNAA